MWSKLSKTTLFKLLSALLLYILIGAAFAELLEEVHQGETLTIDESILFNIYATASPFWDTFYVWLTQFGGFYGIAFLSLVTTLVLLKNRKFYSIIFLYFSVVGAGFLNAGIKLLVGRERPELWEQIITETSHSFPSGHAMGSSALAFALMFIFLQTKWRWPITLLAAIYMVLIGYSRLYLGVHYPTDIIGGWLAGIAWVATVGILLYGYRWHRNKRAVRESASPSE